MFRSRSAKAFALGLAAALPAGCEAAPERVPAGAPAFDPIAFFSGRTEGRGTVKIILSGAEPLRVEGRGRVEGDGSLLLDQTIWRGERKPQSRQWRMRAVGPGRYRGTLTDAVGPVMIETRGPVLRIGYDAKDGTIEQQLTLDAAGRVATNRMVVRRLGLVVARIDETIRKLD